ncbi:MAG: VOC family protein [Gemmatimonadaceae bacterium]
MASTLDYGIAPPGYRLPEATRLGRVRLQVASLERSLPFYEQVLGFLTLQRHGDVAVLGAHGDDTPLVELHAREGVRPVPRSGLLGLYHVAILLPDRASLGRFLAHLAGVGARAGMSDHLVSEAIYLQDPDNLGIEVYADRPRSAWAHRGRELTMTTIPLDARDVVAAARGGPWTGMPSGTIIGHVHLHVGDIDRASRFYHEGLGFDRVVWSYPGALFLSAGGYHHHLGTNSWAAHAPPAGEDDARLLDWEIVVPAESDLMAVGASLRGQGNSVATATNSIEVADPWGTLVRVRTE